MGPLLMRRNLFAHLGGFDERLFRRGRPASLLDCELSARVWSAQLAVVLARARKESGQLYKPFTQRYLVDSAAWHTYEQASAVDDFERCNHIHRILNFRDPQLQQAIRTWDAEHGHCIKGGVPKGSLLAKGRRFPPERAAAVFNFSARTDPVLLSEALAATSLPQAGWRRHNVSFAVQYWGGYREPFDDFWGNYSQRLQRTVLPMLTRVAAAAAVAELSAEVLVNVDSRHIRLGDHADLLGGLSDPDTLLLSPNTHELRGLNRLALLADGELVCFVQDDSCPPPIDVDLTWLVHPLVLLTRFPTVGSIGLSMGLFYVAQHGHQAAYQTLRDLPDAHDHMPVCSVDGSGTWLAADGSPSANMVAEHRQSQHGLLVQPRVHVEAMRCADFGPLFVRRSAFLAVGGFNENGTTAGEPGSVRVDCEVQARMWLLQPQPMATLYLGLQRDQRWTHSEERRAWGHPKMMQGHATRQRDYWERFERDGSSARMAIEAAARRMNSHFACPPMQRVSKARRESFMAAPLLASQ